MLRPGTKSNYPSLKLGELSDAQAIIWGKVISVNSESQTMRVSIPSQEDAETDDIPINNTITKRGVGFRMMPVPHHTIVLLLKFSSQYVHIGYALEGLEQFTEDKFGKKTATALLQRFLEEGEIQLYGLSGNEIFLSNNGSVLLKTQDNSYIKLENTNDTFEGLFKNMKFEMDGVRIRAGNTRRPLRGYGKEEVNMVIDSNNEILQSTELNTVDNEIEDFVPIREFTVQVGTAQNEDGLDKPFDQRDTSGSSPTIGYISMANKVLNEDGTPFKISNKDVIFAIRLSNGGGFAVTEDNSAYILDYVGRQSTKFGAGGGAKSLRASDNTFLEVDDASLVMQHKSRVSVELKEDGDGFGELILNNDTGRNIVLNKMGVSINMDGSYINQTAKEISLNAEKITIGGILAATAGDALLKAKLTATAFDTHVHAGPSGPPITPWTPLVLAGSITATGINVG